MMTAASKREQGDCAYTRPHPGREAQKAPLKELRDIMNMTKGKMPLGDISSLFPKSTTAFSSKHQNLIPEGPHKPIVSKPVGPKALPARQLPQKTEASHSQPAVAAKKNLSIRIPDGSPKAQQIRMFQFKSQSTKHANANSATNSSLTTDQQCAAMPLQPGCNIVIPNYEPAKCSLKRNGVIRAYAASTNQGLVRLVRARSSSIGIIMRTVCQ